MFYHRRSSMTATIWDILFPDPLVSGEDVLGFIPFPIEGKLATFIDYSGIKLYREQKSFLDFVREMSIHGTNIPQHTQDIMNYLDKGTNRVTYDLKSYFQYMFVDRGRPVRDDILNNQHYINATYHTKINWVVGRDEPYAWIKE